MQRTVTTAEHARLDEIRDEIFGWRRWGPYVSERAWATVREDYSPDGDAWGHFSARPGPQQGLSLGGGRHRRHLRPLSAPRASPRPSGTAATRSSRSGSSASRPHEGNHGEDVKEYYYYLDNTPTHSYMKYLYKYPQAEYPYSRLIEENRRRGRARPRVRAARHGHLRRGPLLRHRDRIRQGDDRGHLHPDRGVQPRPRAGDAAHPAAALVSQHLGAGASRGQPSPTITRRPQADGLQLVADDLDRRDLVENLPVPYRLGPRTLYAPPGGDAALHRQRNQHGARLRPGCRNPRPLRQGRLSSLRSSTARPARTRQQRARRPRSTTGSTRSRPGGSVVLRLRLSDGPTLSDPLAEVDEIDRPAPRRGRRVLRQRSIRPTPTDDERLIQRQALAGLLWNKQCYIFDVSTSGSKATTRPAAPGFAADDPQPALAAPEFAASDDACPTSGSIPGSPPGTWRFSASAIALVDPQYAKDQLWVLLFEQFQHPNGQIPAYEWEFSDLNPPVHAWAVWRVYNMARIRTGPGRPRLSRTLLPQAADQFRLVGQQGRLARATTSSRGGSWGSTTSPSSIAAIAIRRRGRARAVRRAPAGWGCSA